jgi:hypothetical protein
VPSSSATIKKTAGFSLPGQNVPLGAPLAQPFMSGIQPVSLEAAKQEKPSIAAFEFETEAASSSSVPAPSKPEKKGKKSKKGRR